MRKEHHGQIKPPPRQEVTRRQILMLKTAGNPTIETAHILRPHGPAPRGVAVAVLT